MINVGTLDELEKLLINVPIDKIVFWIGAGIDCGKPTSLPLGNDLTDYILEKTCGENAEKVVELWEKRQQLFNTVMSENLELPNRPRLETVLEAVKIYEDHQIHKKTIIKGLTSFSSSVVSYNNEHFLLAQLLHEGANIVTTNYGDFICEAYKDLYGETEVIHEYENVHLYRVSNEWSSCIYHIHGVSSDLETIGVNLKNVKKSLPSSFKEKFKYWIENDYVVIFMGYSGLDSLDVNPFLNSFINNEGATGIYVRHTKEEIDKVVTNSESRLLAAFKNKYVCPCITSEFFKIINGYENTRYQEYIKDVEEWKIRFDKYMDEYDEDNQKAFLSVLCFLLGIPITEFWGEENWIREIYKDKNVDDWYKAYYAFQNATITAQKKIVREQGERLREKNNKLMENDYQHARGNYKKLKVKFDEEIVEKLKDKIQRKEIVDWGISTPLNRYTEYVFMNYIKYGAMYFGRNKRLKADIKNIKNCKECLEKIIKGNYDCVLEVNQINTAYRSLALCRSLLGEDVSIAISNINIALENYIDVSSVNGVAMTLFYKAMVYLVDYRKNSNLKSLSYAHETINDAYRVIYGCKLKKYYRRYIFGRIEYGIDAVISHIKSI